MAFPSAIANEPPPCMSSEDEDSEEFQSHRLKLDVPSGDPTPVSTPLKKAKPTPNSTTIVNTSANDNDDLVLEVIPGADFDEASPTETALGSHPQPDQEFINLPKENGTNSPEPEVDEFSIGGGNDFPVNYEKVVTVTAANHELSTASSISNNNDSLRRDSDDADGSVAATSSASEPETATEICDNTANGSVSEIYQSSGHCEQVGPSSPSGESGEADDNLEDVIGSINQGQQIEQDELCDKDESARVPTPSSPHVENRAEGPSEIREDLNRSDFADDTGFQAASSSSVEVVHQPGSPSNNESATGGGLVDQNDFDDEYDDFGAFQSIPDSSVVNKQEQGIDIGASSAPQSVGFDDEDDDFGDFAQVPTPQATGSSVQAPQASAQSRVDDSEGFADFQDCSFQSFGAPALVRRHSSITSDISLISSKVESIVKSLFVAESSLPDPDEVKWNSIDSEISIANDQVWATVQDFEGSQGLTFKWGNSLTEKRLLRSLNIDNSNIMYHEKWGTIEVPKFAASLVMSSPLQPESCNPNVADSQVKDDSRNVNVNNNNLKEGISCQDQDKPPSISAEAQEILRQLPDLSYMRANTLVFPQTSPSGI